MNDIVTENDCICFTLFTKHF